MIDVSQYHDHPASSVRDYFSHGDTLVFSQELILDSPGKDRATVLAYNATLDQAFLAYDDSTVQMLVVTDVPDEILIRDHIDRQYEIAIRQAGG